MFRVYGVYIVYIMETPLMYKNNMKKKVGHQIGRKARVMFRRMFKGYINRTRLGNTCIGCSKSITISKMNK